MAKRDPEKSMQKSAAPLAGAPARRPWWIPFFLGSVPDIGPHALMMLGTVGFAVFFEGYDLALLTSALSFIADDLGMAEESLGGWTGLIRLGGLPAVLLLPFADRIGRRRVFLASLIGLSVATLLTAFSPTVEAFVAMQMIARVSYITFSATAVVIIAEELPAEHRGWGLGIFGALAALGWGSSAILFSFIEVLPGGWRFLYLVGAVPLLFFPMFRRNIRETRRFETGRQERLASGDAATGLHGWIQPIHDLATTYPRRMIGVTLACFLFAAGELAVMQFVGYFVLEERGWEPWQFSTMVILTGSVGLAGNVYAGRLGDRFGRRPIGLITMTLVPVGAVLFFHANDAVLPAAWIILSLGTIASNLVLRALVTESFPTNQRSTAAGWMTLLGTLGAAAGLWAVALGRNAGMELTTIISLVSLLASVAGFCLFLLPETSGRELEEISSAHPS
ncbi:MAG: MFS transporter [Deltaproteobacteria bacterium]